MAVDYLHRLVVEGSPEQVRAFRRTMHREYPRALGKETWTEVVPFSFTALYELAPSARRVEREIPCDPYELVVWPVKRLAEGRAQVRYQFHTRNLEMVALLRALSRALPPLTFTLMTFCYDDSSAESYRLSRGKARKWVLPQRRQEFHWERARKKFSLVGEDVYDDDAAEQWAEEGMRHEALDHWERSDSGGRRHYQWWNRPRLRDLATEREIAMYEAIEALYPTTPRKKRKATKRRGPNKSGRR
jgi:hypothetical protein